MQFLSHICLMLHWFWRNIHQNYISPEKITEKITQAKVFSKIEKLTQALFSKFQTFSDNVALENCILISNLFTKHYQKSFMTDSLYPLNLKHIAPDGQTMVV